MRALSFRQPFAWLTVHGHKPTENRTWNTSYRGWFLVHASQQYGLADTALARDMLRRLGAERLTLPLRLLSQSLERGYAHPGEDLRWRDTGGIIGMARLDGVLPPILQGYGDALPDWRLWDQYGWQLGAVKPLPFVPCSGLHKFWRVKPELEARLCEHLTALEIRELQEADRAFSKAA